MRTLVSPIFVGAFALMIALFARYDEQAAEKKEPGTLNFREYLGALPLAQKELRQSCCQGLRRITKRFK